MTRDHQATMLRTSHQDAVFTSEEITMIRRTLSVCPPVLTWTDQHGDHQVREMMA